MAPPRFKAARLKSPNEFRWLIEHITHEAYRVRDNWDCWEAIDTAAEEYSNELNLTPNFWHITRRAHQDAVVLRLGRLYDQHPSALSLGKLLQTIREQSLSEERLISLPESGLNASELTSDITLVSDDDPIVGKLSAMRNEYLAHRNWQHVARGTFACLPNLQADDIRTLIHRALNVLTKYREALGYTPLLWGNHEATDFRRLLSLLHIAVRFSETI